VCGFDDIETTHKALAAFGMKPEHKPNKEHQDIWPENLHAFRVFCRLRTQWNCGMNGPVGLRYEAASLALRLEQVPPREWPEVIEGIQQMEIETLRIWREKR
jgi:hypothetical protein